MRENEGSAAVADRVPGAVAWVASGVIADVVVWLVLVHLPFFDTSVLMKFLLVPAAVCWTHVVVLPRLVWLGQLPRWGDLGLVAAGAVITFISVGIGLVVGLLTGFATFFVGGLPGFLVGGGVSALIAIRLMRLFPASGIPIRTDPAVLAGSILSPPLFFIVIDQSTDLAALATVVGVGLIASFISIPEGRSSWPGARASWVLAATALVLVAGSGWLLWSQPIQAARAVREAGELRCPAGFTPDCLANAAFVVAQGAPEPWLSNREPSDAAVSVARDLARIGFAEQARDLVRASDAKNREDVAIRAKAGQVAQAARMHPEIAADLTPLEQLGSAALNRGLAALATSLTGRAEPSGQVQVRDAMPATLAGVPTLRAAVGLWRTLLPTLQGRDATAARIGLARLLVDLGERQAAARLLDPLRVSGAMSARDWLRAGDGEAALLAGAQAGKGELAAVAAAATALVRQQGGAGAGFWASFENASASLLMAEINSQDTELAADVRAVVRVMARLGDMEQARAVADRVASRSRALATAEDYALAVASYLDIGETEQADELITLAEAALPVAALACSDAQPPSPGRSACTAQDVAEKRRWLGFAVQMHRLGRSLTGFRLATADVSMYQHRLAEELSPAGLPPAPLADRLLGVSPGQLSRAAMTRWAEGDEEGARFLLSLLSNKRLPVGEEPDPARLAAALGDRELQLALTRNLLARLRIDQARTAVDARTLVNTAVYWRENLPPDAVMDAPR